MRILLWTTILATMPFLGHSEIPMVGQNEKGEPIEFSIPENVYKQNLTKALSEVEKSTLVSLQSIPDEGKPWMLRSVVVGIGVNMEVKLGPVIKFGALPRFRVGFSNAAEPSIP